MVNLASLNPAQRQAVETLSGPVLILAGAGTGKTRVITYRIAHLILRGIPPGSILGVTFTNKAAREMQQRIRELIPRERFRTSEGEPEQPTVCTFHALCVRILRHHIEKLGYKRNFVIYDESDQMGVLRRILSGISTAGEKVDPAAVLAMLGRYRNGGVRAAAFADDGVAAMAQHIRTRYEQSLKACNAVDFDDLILLTLRLFREHPDALEACRRRYRQVMVDEYQDTNSSQFELIHALTMEHRNLCVVGDDDQSIYGWRGAEIANLLEMEKHYPEVKVIKLEQNYRSTNTILHAANAVIRNNVRRRGKQLWSQKGDGARIVLQAYETEEEEARSVVEEVEFNRQARRTAWKDQAILFRTNGQSRPLETALRKAGVRYHLVGGQSYFDRREVRDFLAYLKVCANPRDDISLLRIANVPARGLSEATMERLLSASQERGGSVFAVMEHREVLARFPVRAQEAITSFVTFLNEARSSLAGLQGSGISGGLSGWADRLLANAGYWGELRRTEKDPEAAASRAQSLKDLIATMDDTGAPGEPAAERLLAFLEELSLASDREEEQENSGDAVTLITMHSCKGLEFPHVFIVGLEDGILPHARSKAEGSLDEERRLFYVAITRAMETLTVSHCGGRKRYGQLMPCHPSPFLKELPEHLVEDGSKRAKQPVGIETGKGLFAAIREVIG